MFPSTRLFLDRLINKKDHLNAIITCCRLTIFASAHYLSFNSYIKMKSLPDTTYIQYVSVKRACKGMFCKCNLCKFNCTPECEWSYMWSEWNKECYKIKTSVLFVIPPSWIICKNNYQTFDTWQLRCDVINIDI